MNLKNSFRDHFKIGLTLQGKDVETQRNLRRLRLAGCVLVATLAACGGGGGSSGTPSTSTGSTAPASGTSTSPTSSTSQAFGLRSPWGLTFDSAGNLYVVDETGAIEENNTAGVGTVLAGSLGVQGNVDGQGSSAEFNFPKGIVPDGAGNLFVADTGNYLIRKIASNDAVSTFAGTYTINTGLDGTGTNATFAGPQGIAIDSHGNFFVVDTGDTTSTVREITPTGVVTTFAGGSNGYKDGTGTAAEFNTLYGIAIDSQDNLYVTDTDNHVIRKITPAAVVTTFAGIAGVFGSVDGSLGTNEFDEPSGITLDKNTGNIFVTDYRASVIREITPAGIASTIAGTPYTYGYADGTGAAIKFNGLMGIAINSAGTLAVADISNSKIRYISQSGVSTTYSPSSSGSTGSGPAGSSSSSSGSTGSTSGSSSSSSGNTGSNSSSTTIPSGTVLQTPSQYVVQPVSPLLETVGSDFGYEYGYSVSIQNGTSTPITCVVNTTYTANSGTQYTAAINIGPIAGGGSIGGGETTPASNLLPIANASISSATCQAD
jgi:sugar lactone lactonase YvrE